MSGTLERYAREITAERYGTEDQIEAEDIADLLPILAQFRDEVLEEAALVAEHCDQAHGSRHAGHYDSERCIAAGVRALKASQ